MRRVPAGSSYSTNRRVGSTRIRPRILTARLTFVAQSHTPCREETSVIRCIVPELLLRDCELVSHGL